MKNKLISVMLVDIDQNNNRKNASDGYGYFILYYIFCFLINNLIINLFLLYF